MKTSAKNAPTCWSAVASLYYQLEPEPAADCRPARHFALQRLAHDQGGARPRHRRNSHPQARSTAIFTWNRRCSTASVCTDAYVLLSGQPIMRDEEALYGVGQAGRHLSTAGHRRHRCRRRVHRHCLGHGRLCRRQRPAGRPHAPPDRHRADCMGSVGAYPTHLIDGPDLARLLAAKLGGRYFDLHAPVLVAQPALREHAGARAVRARRAVSTGGAWPSPSPASAQWSRKPPASCAPAISPPPIWLQSAPSRALSARRAAASSTPGAVGRASPSTPASSALRWTICASIPRVIAVARGLPKAHSILAALRGALSHRPGDRRPPTAPFLPPPLKP
jgi:hypothetical protein